MTVLLRRMLAAAVVSLVAGCSLVDAVRRTPPPPPWTVPPPAGFELRSRPISVPDGFRTQTVTFLNARVGAALFSRCALPKRRVGNHNDCAARLFVTRDGGDSWEPREHPEPVADAHQLSFGAGGEIVLLAEPRHWFVSGDEGRTFRAVPSAPAGDEFRLCCEPEPLEVTRAGRVLEGPDLYSLTALLHRPGRDLWVASVASGTAFTAVSTDSGRTWTNVAVPNRTTGRVRASLQASSDREDLWLLAATSSPQEFPEIWRLDGGTWVSAVADGHPPLAVSTAPVGAGLLAVSTLDGIGLVAPGQRWTPTNWPARGSLQVLGDGTLLVRDDLDGAWWLGPGSAAQRRWIKLELRREP